MDAATIGTAGLKGWRGKVGDTVAPPLSRVTPLSDDQVRALVGAAFFVLSLVYVIGTLRRIARR